jgi:hypothetical protein
MERRALAVALALTIPLALYGIPYAYAATNGATYVVQVSASTPSGQGGDLTPSCNRGDYATGGGFTLAGATTPAEVFSSQPGGGAPPTLWSVSYYNDLSTSVEVIAYVVCQSPITVAGLGVPQFGSLYAAIALGAVVYFMLSRQFQRRPTISTPVQP